MIKKLLLPFLLIISFNIFSQNEIYSIGLGSCLDQESDQDIWEAVKNENLKEFIFLGDNVYGDLDNGELTNMQSAYDAQFKKIPAWLKKIKVSAVWDDHDYGINDGGSEYRYKRESQEMFHNFWNQFKEEEIKIQREGIYFSNDSLINGKIIKTIGLDTRFFRSSLEGRKGNYQPTEDQKKTILGITQWKWLEEQFEENSDLIILASSIQVIATNHGFEKWKNFPHERQRLINLINKYNKPVIIVSGDRHKAGIYKINKLVEITASSLNKPLPRWISSAMDLFEKETDEALTGEMHYEINYGIIRFQSDNSISVELKNESGKILEKFVLTI